MSITCRKGTLEDIPKLIEIEKKAIPSLQYLFDARKELFDDRTGEMIVAEEDGEPVGFGRFTLQYDGAAWLEVLRVAPEHQRKGDGAAIWERYMELCDKHKVPAVRMYTGRTNIGSKTLSRRNGLNIAYDTIEGSLAAANAPEGSSGEFTLVEDPEVTAELLAPFEKDYHGYFSINRTYYKLDKPLYDGITRERMVFTNGEDTYVMGARFLKDRALFIGMACGDIDACVASAVAEFKKSGLPKLTCMIPSEREDIKAVYEKYGFVFPAGHIIMMEREFLPENSTVDDKNHFIKRKTEQWKAEFNDYDAVFAGWEKRACFNIIAPEHDGRGLDGFENGTGARWLKPTKGADIGDAVRMMEQFRYYTESMADGVSSELGRDGTLRPYPISSFLIRTFADERVFFVIDGERELPEDTTERDELLARCRNYGMDVLTYLGDYKYHAYAADCDYEIYIGATWEGLAGSGEKYGEYRKKKIQDAVRL